MHVYAEIMSGVGGSHSIISVWRRKHNYASMLRSVLCSQDFRDGIEKKRLGLRRICKQNKKKKIWNTFSDGIGDCLLQSYLNGYDSIDLFRVANSLMRLTINFRQDEESG